MKFSALAAALCLTALVASPASAARAVPRASMAAVDANKILAELDKRAAAYDDQSYRASMKINKGGATKKTLEFEMVMKGLTKQFITFTAPGDVAGMKVLMQDPTTLYVYMPEFKKVRRVAAHALNQGFLGSTWTYEDMTMLKLSAFYDAELGGQDGNETTLKLTLKEGKSGTYPRMDIVIDKTKGGVTKLRYFDKSDTQVREQLREGWKKVEGHNVPTEVSMRDLKTGDTTKITLSDLQVNQGVEDDLFSRRNLLRG